MRTSRIALVVVLALAAIGLGAVTAALTRGGTHPRTWPAVSPSWPVTAAGPPQTAPAPTPTRSQRVYLAGYGWWDNSPHGTAEISNPVVHRTAGGTGTWADPITAAVPYHCASGCLEWPAGTRFYLPALKRYVVVEDTCGERPDSCDGDKSEQLVVWVGGDASTVKTSEACEDALPRRTDAVEDPPAGLAVTPGDIC